MADIDLNEIQSSGSTKVVGSDASGVEQTPVKSSANGDLSTMDLADAGGVQGVIAVTTTPVAVRVGVANLANRKRLLFINTGAVNLYWGFSNTVSSANGMILYRNQSVADSFGPNTTIWIVTASGSGGVSVAEAA